MNDRNIYYKLKILFQITCFICFTTGLVGLAAPKSATVCIHRPENGGYMNILGTRLIVTIVDPKTLDTKIEGFSSPELKGGDFASYQLAAGLYDFRLESPASTYSNDAIWTSDWQRVALAPGSKRFFLIIPKSTERQNGGAWDLIEVPAPEEWRKAPNQVLLPTQSSDSAAGPKR